jgi:hypothetical protein
VCVIPYLEIRRFIHAHYRQLYTTKIEYLKCQSETYYELVGLSMILYSNYFRDITNFQLRNAIDFISIMFVIPCYALSLSSYLGQGFVSSMSIMVIMKYSIPSGNFSLPGHFLIAHSNRSL